jgi:DNA ligase (NAD+)
MIEIPTKCPSCGHSLTSVNDQLYCKNKECEAQTLKKLEHFAKTLKIKGMGPKTLEKLNFDTPHDFYTYSVGHYVDALGEKIGRKLFNEVAASKSTELALVLAAFSIPLIGNTASAKLAKVVRSIEEISADKCKEASLGEKATANLLEWLTLEEYKGLPFTFRNTRSSNTTGANSKNVTVCITGKLNDFTNRSDAEYHLNSLGFTCVSSVTKGTTVLIDEEGKTSSKRAKAETLGVEILTINELLERYKN